MKPGFVFGFENAGWPALLVNAGAVIVRFNAAAGRVFGPVLQADTTTRMAQIWSRENPLNAEAFLEKWQHHPAASTALKFNVRGINVSYTTVVCEFVNEGETLFAFQLFPDLGNGIGSAESHAVEGTGTMQKNKLDLALQLARSVALDFNNALAGVMGNSSLLLMRAEPDHPWRKSLLEIEKAAEKGAEIADYLQAFGCQERQSKSLATGNLNAVLRHAAAGLRAQPGASPVNWEFNLAPKLFQARFDEAKIQQAFVRIFENAVQAMTGAGSIVVSTRNLENTAPTQDRNARLAAGTYVCAEIADTGCGIDTAVMPRIFEPFFTTKGSGGHRGLGLVLAYGVITNLGGAIAVSSKIGVGTSVRIYLPAEKTIVQEAGAAPADLRGAETILLVDDEELVLNMAREVLSVHGYNVVGASSGQQALRLFSNPEFIPDLLLTDLFMPGMSGTELAQAARGVLPRLPIIIMSGAVRSNDQNDLTHLAKPFTSRDLLVRVRLVLGNVGRA